MSEGGEKVSVSVSSNAMKTPENHEEIQKQFLRTYPALATCGKCNKSQFTRVERKMNWVNCAFACCCNCCWTFYMLYKWKDASCCDADHSCSSCGEKLAEYNAMK